MNGSIIKFNTVNKFILLKNIKLNPKIYKESFSKLNKRRTAKIHSVSDESFELVNCNWFLHYNHS